MTLRSRDHRITWVPFSNWPPQWGWVLSESGGAKLVAQNVDLVAVLALWWSQCPAGLGHNVSVWVIGRDARISLSEVREDDLFTLG
jgi:hypothetical protein